MCTEYCRPDWAPSPGQARRIAERQLHKETNDKDAQKLTRYREEQCLVAGKGRIGARAVEDLEHSTLDDHFAHADVTRQCQRLQQSNDGRTLAPGEGDQCLQK